MLYREFAIDTRSINDSSREVSLSFSSDKPVVRTDWRTGDAYNEVLDHSGTNADFSRLNKGGAFLVNHNTDDQVGAVKPGTAVVGPDGVGRAVIKMSSSARGKEILQDMRDGIRGLVSFGYRTVKELGREVVDGIETRRFSFMAYEISSVPIPADESVGVGRASALITESRNSMNPEVNQRVSEIEAIARNIETRNPAIRQLADRCIAAGTDLESFRAQALEYLPQCQPIGQPAKLEIKPRDLQRYSIARALHTMATGRQLDGFEREMNDEMKKRNGKEAEGIWIPDEVFAVQHRSLVAGTSTLGGFLVETENLGDQFIGLLRNKAKCMELGARTLNLTHPVTIPRQNGAGATNWVGETTAATLSTANFTQLTLSPTAVSAFQQYSKQLLITGNPSIDALIKADIVEQIALAIDLAAIHGTGSGQPTGIANTTGISTVLLAANGQALNNSTAYPAMVSLETLVSASNADEGALGFMIRPQHRGALRVAQRFTSTDSPVYKDGKILDYRAEVSAQILNNLTTGTSTTATSILAFGNWNDLLIANFSGVDVTIDPYTLAQNAVVRILARKWVDIGVRHPASFALLLGIL